MWEVYNNEGMTKMVRKFRRDFREIQRIKKEEIEKTIIRRDFNARTGEEGYMYTEETMEKREG